MPARSNRMSGFSINEKWIKPCRGMSEEERDAALRRPAGEAARPCQVCRAVESQVMRAIANWEEVPLFDSDQAEADFWAENKPDLRLLEASLAGGSEGAESVTITLRIDPRMLARIKRMARSRYLNYQSMIKQWLSERMEQELRER
jgi:hypothetical protein